MDKTTKRLKLLIVRHQEDEAAAAARKAAKADTFHKVSVKISNKVGTPMAFYAAVLAILIWIVTGPLFGFSDTWQLVINTGTTIITFLMVFVIQNTQNRDGKAMQLKLDELIKSNRAARTEFVDVEDLSDAELDELQAQFKDIHDKLK